MNRSLLTLLIGRILTNFADSFYMIATIWYVKTVTHSPFLIGLTSAVAILPVTLQFLYGPLIDRYSKRKILTIAMTGQAVIVSIIALLYFSDLLWLPLLFLLMFFALSLSESTYPTESALIQQITPREKLTKVNSIFSFSYQTLDLLCDAISGVLIVFVGLGVIYLANSFILFAIAILFLLYLQEPKSPKKASESTVGFWRQYKEDFIQGLSVVKERKKLLQLLFGIIGINVMATMSLAMLPVISSSSAEFGFWLTSMSIGVLVGTVLSSKVERFPLNRVFPLASFFSGAFWILSIVNIEHLILRLTFFGLAWVGVGVLSIFVQTLIQVNLPEEHIGSGFSFLSSLLGSLSPLGYLLGGLLAEWTSSTLILLLAAIGYLGFSLYYILNSKLNKLVHPLGVSFEKT
ncbi:MFS transporter [Bacillus sp. 2205SS5-2]|uniref:MFS transporter n=1 Tax=Bacillus sp. 2205SS5-2 TaxID=3109031 RepID=UPI0030047B10